MYGESDDPWGFDSDPYEQRKYTLTVAALPDPSYRSAVEPGCANGALSELLAPRCDRLVSFDVIPAAVLRAQARLRSHPGAVVVQASFPEFWPAGTGDLVVWSEVAYYLTDAGAEMARVGLERFLEPSGVVLAVHYTGTTDYPRTGGAIGRWLDEVDFLDRETTLVDPLFELGVWRRRLV